MKKVEVTEAAALKAHKEAGTEGKTLLENLYGKDLFNQNITDRIKTFEDACAFTNTDPDHPKFKDGDPDEIAYKKLKVIIKALNEGWEPNWDNGREAKWRPWFYLDQPGFRFLGADYGYSVSSVGSRLCFKSEELCRYAAKQFLDLYKDLFTK